MSEIPPIRMYTVKELAQMYERHPTTLKGYLKPYEKLIGKEKGKHSYTAEQVKIIFACIGPPISDYVDNKSDNKK